MIYLKRFFLPARTSKSPSHNQSENPSISPSENPSENPNEYPSQNPSQNPSQIPSRNRPIASLTNQPLNEGLSMRSCGATLLGSMSIVLFDFNKDEDSIDTGLGGFDCFTNHNISDTSFLIVVSSVDTVVNFVDSRLTVDLF